MIENKTKINGNLKEKDFIYWLQSTKLVDPIGTTTLRNTVLDLSTQNYTEWSTQQWTSCYAEPTVSYLPPFWITIFLWKLVFTWLKFMFFPDKTWFIQKNWNSNGFAQPLWKAGRIITVGNVGNSQLHICCTKGIWLNIFLYQLCIVNSSQQSHIAILCLQENYSQHLQLDWKISSNG
jgi:hypothetical protein